MSATVCLFSLPMPGDAQELSRALRRRDPELLDWLMERYRYRLFRYLFCVTGSQVTAEDLFQETWVRVLEKGHQYDGKRSFETWLFAIARHLVIDLYRRRKAQPLELLAGPDGAGGAAQIQDREALSPLEAFESCERSERVAAALRRLPAAYCEALVLRFQEDMALEEISAVTAAPLSTVKSRVYRGLEALRDLLEEVA